MAELSIFVTGKRRMVK